MRRLRPAPNLAVATLWSDLLCEAGIAVTVQREFACGLAGQIPADQALPEIWVSHEEQYERALALLDDLERCPQRNWSCNGCGEHVEGPFEHCWNCGTAMPHDASAA
jgi:Putative prokaryotic signal transducing protein